MRELVVCSGKGGTGRTSVVAALASVASDLVLADCDVDAANLHLVLAPETEHRASFVSGHVASIRGDDCEGCGECRTLCRFEAVTPATTADGRTVFGIDPLACEGCGVCVQFCPRGAIDLSPARIGRWSRSTTRFGPLIHARLDAGAENSGQLVTLVRQEARREAERRGARLILVDGPPGSGFPVAAAITGADSVLLVTEPGVAALHDLDRILDLAVRVRVPPLVCINKYDLSREETARLEAACAGRRVPVAARIPFDPEVTAAQVAGRSLLETAPDSPAGRALRGLWSDLESRLFRS